MHASHRCGRRGREVLVLSAAGAAAHTEWQPEDAAPGSVVDLTLFVEDEQPDAGRPRSSCSSRGPHGGRLPAVPGWTATVVDGQVGGPATGVTWEGGPNPDDVMPITLSPLPDQPGRLQFKVVQTYDNGTVDRWIDDWPEGAEEPLNPGPVLGLVPGAAGTIPATTAPPTTAAPTTTTTAATAAPRTRRPRTARRLGDQPGRLADPRGHRRGRGRGGLRLHAPAPGGRERVELRLVALVRRRAGRVEAGVSGQSAGPWPPAPGRRGMATTPVARQDTDGDQHMAGDQHGQHVGGEAVDVVQPHEGRARARS